MGLGLGLGLGLGPGLGLGLAGCTPARVNPNRVYAASTLQAKWISPIPPLQAKWIGKTDDDSLTYLPRLEHELRLMAQMARRG